MDKGQIFLLIGLSFLFLAVLIPILQLRKRIKLKADKSAFKKVFEAVLLPVNFGALFLNNRKVEQLPAYYRWFLKFTEFTSRIPYFHFLPKALVAFIAEGVIDFFTGEDILTAIIFCWSLLFLTIILTVEKQAGEMEEEIITFANKLFLYTVSVLTLVMLLAYAFFWETLEPKLDIPFLNFMGEMTHLSNEYLIAFGLYFWNSSIILKILVIGILIAYASSSYYLSKKLDK